MKISTTSFGNYKPVQPNQNIKFNQTIKQTSDPQITNEEKRYFSNLYPEQKEKIDNYHFYSREGSKNGVSLGSLFDRRG